MKQRCYCALCHSFFNVSIKRAYQIYHYCRTFTGARTLQLLGFSKVQTILPRFLGSIVCTYQHLKKSSVVILAVPSKLIKAKIEVWDVCDSDSHCIGKGEQGRSSGCNWSTLYFCEKCNITLHPEYINHFSLAKEGGGYAA